MAQETIDELHGKGSWVACYISVGSVEPWREDADRFPSGSAGRTLELYPDEKYVDITIQVSAYRTGPHLENLKTSRRIPMYVVTTNYAYS